MSRRPAQRLVVCVESRAKAGPYVEALKEAGAVAERLQVITPENAAGDLEHTGAACAGLLLCGGPDMEPWRYGETPRPDARLSLLPELDQLEWDLLTGAAATHRPVWAVCRGLQTVNVFLGGSLWQDIPSQLDDAVEHAVAEPLDAMAHPIGGGEHHDPWAGALTAGPLEVNSRHHQALRELGRDISPVAHSPDGLIEAAVVSREDWWVKGVQWHPEDLLHQPIQKQLWHEFLDAAAAAAGERRGEEAS
ncbi:MAG: gamma-glutamyl-gamma-aminobutyrate hydrolase family protein [Thermoanaerobaculia bacterium]